MPRLHALKKPRVRQDWSKENLYNLSRLSTPPAAQKTFFQQKWLAKSMTRGYHNPYVREGQWTRMFDRRLPAVVSMDHRYLARNDGSEQARGRGSGEDQEPRNDGRPERRIDKTPYMNMTFYPLERRLDTAIFRALFASSAIQARQFVVHGHVKVNGKKMIYPGYQLNPGDMFQVDPERVMFATGARKRRKTSPISDQHKRKEAEAAAAAEEEAARMAPRNQEADEESESGAATLMSDADREALETKPEDETDSRKAMKNLVQRAKRILDDSKRQLSGKRQQELRAFAQSVRKTMSKHGSSGDKDTTTSTLEDLETSLAGIMTKIPDDVVSKSTDSEPGAPAPSIAAAQEARDARKDAALLTAALAKARANPRDAAKPYATPWQPRDYMSAFAFIPRYLEVNQNICSAVYLRHPVARPGLAEVPTPFHTETLELAFNWYLRRR